MRPKKIVLIQSSDEAWTERLRCVLKVRGYALAEDPGAKWDAKVIHTGARVELVPGDARTGKSPAVPANNMEMVLEAVELNSTKKRGPKPMRMVAK